MDAGGPCWGATGLNLLELLVAFFTGVRFFAFSYGIVHRHVGPSALGCSWRQWAEFVPSFVKEMIPVNRLSRIAVVIVLSLLVGRVADVGLLRRPRSAEAEKAASRRLRPRRPSLPANPLSGPGRGAAFGAQA